MPLKAFVVEDNLQIRDSLIEALAELGGIDSAGTATNEKDAIAWLRDPAHQWDIAIIDLVLQPGGSGFGVLKAMQDRPSHRKMVVLTGSASPDVRKRCESLGADGVFDKSMETEALLDYCELLSRAAGN